MRRSGQYADHGANVYVGGQMSSQRKEIRSESDHFQGRLEAFTPEREHPYAPSKEWRWERDDSKIPNPMASQMYNEGQGVDASRSHFQGKGLGLEQKAALVKQGNIDHRFGHCEEDMQIGFEDKPMLQMQTFEGLRDNLTNLVKELNDYEHVENSRHREKINAINAQYEEQLVGVRGRHAMRRDEFLRKESVLRQNQYQRSSAVSPSDYMGNLPAAVMNEAHRAYNNESFVETYRDRQLIGGSRDKGFQPRGSFHGGPAYDANANPRYY